MESQKLQHMGWTGCHLSSLLSSALFSFSLIQGDPSHKEVTSSSGLKVYLLKDLRRKATSSPKPCRGSGEVFLLSWMPTMPVLATVVREKYTADGTSSPCAPLNYTDREQRWGFPQGKLKCSDKQNEGWMQPNPTDVHHDCPFPVLLEICLQFSWGPSSRPADLANRTTQVNLNFWYIMNNVHCMYASWQLFIWNLILTWNLVFYLRAWH